MKKEHKTYVLLVTVLIVWGIVGLQVFNYLSEDELEEQMVISQPNVISQKQFKEKEIYKVQKYLRDPFLGKLTETRKKVILKKKVPKTPVNFPVIIYHGIIESATQTSFIVSVNGSQEVLKKGQILNDVKFLSGDQKEILVAYKGEHKKISLHQ